jgi:hypothetical protein
VVDAVLEKERKRAFGVVVGDRGQRCGTEDHAAAVVPGAAEWRLFDHEHSLQGGANDLGTARQ